MKFKYIILLVIFLLAIPMAQAGKCGNGRCDGNENCATCPQDCLKSGQICCNKKVYSGECCTSNDCSGNSVCSSLHKCISKEPTTTPTTTQNGTSTTLDSKNGGLNWEMIGVLLIVIGGITGWILTRRKRSLISKYISKINNTYKSNKNDSGKCEFKLHNLKEEIEKDFTTGKITEQSYGILNKKIENYIKDVRKGIIKTGFELTSDVKKELHDMLEDGIITEQEYARFIKLDIKSLSKAERTKLNSLMKKWKEKDKLKKGHKKVK